MTLGAQMNGATATEEFVQYEVAEGVGTIWLNRPEVRNCVNWGLLTQLGEALERADADDAVRVVLIRGRGNTCTSPPQDTPQACGMSQIPCGWSGSLWAGQISLRFVSYALITVR